MAWQMLDTLEQCHKKITHIQTRAKDGEVFKPIFPMIIMRTPKGWTTVKELRGQKIEGTILAHQVVMPTVKGDEQELKALEDWLRSYHFEELYNPDKGFIAEVLDIIPDDGFAHGQ